MNGKWDGSFFHNPEDIKGKIPKNYSQMSISIKDMLINEIIIPLYFQKNKLKEAGLTSFGVQGMIINKKLFSIEFNRKERFSTKDFYSREYDVER